MRALIQRVSSGTGRGDGEVVGQTGPGLVVLLGVAPDDTPADADFVADKCVNLRIFEDQDGKMNLSLAQIGGSMLVVSQFTLYADTAAGRRPSLSGAARPETAIPCYDRFIEAVSRLGIPVQTGRFGAYMQLEIHNDGPVTMLVESKTK